MYSRQIEKKNEIRQKYELILYNAIANDEFMVEYQPQVDCLTGKPTGFEALVRINNKQEGKISPLRYLSALRGKELALL